MTTRLRSGLVFFMVLSASALLAAPLEAQTSKVGKRKSRPGNPSGMKSVLWIDFDTEPEEDLKKILNFGTIGTGDDGKKCLNLDIQYNKNKRTVWGAYCAMEFGQAAGLANKKNLFLEFEVFIDGPHPDAGLFIGVGDTRKNSYRGPAGVVPIWKRKSWERRTLNLSTNNDNAFHDRMKKLNSGYARGLRKANDPKLNKEGLKYYTLLFMGDGGQSFNLTKVQIRNIHVYQARTVRKDPTAMGKREIPTKSQEIQSWTQVIEKDPTKAEAYFMRGYAFMKMGDFAAALDDLWALTRLDPTRVYPSFEGRCLLGLGRVDEANAMFRASLKKNLEYAKKYPKRESSFSIALDYYCLGDKEKAAEYRARIKDTSIKRELDKEQRYVDKIRREAPKLK